MITARVRVALAMAATALIASGCGTNGLASLPLPAPGLGSGGYTLTAVFSNALNLPMNAKVKLAGADVGQVEAMVARNYTAVTTLRIRNGVRLPRGSTAELRTATPLGDVFVALKPPADDPADDPMLRGGDTIGLDSTAAAATVESVLSSAAILVNGGAVRNFTNIINGFGKATGDQGQAFGELIRKSNQLVATLDARSDQISGALTELSRLADQLDAKDAAITDLMTAARPAVSALADNTTQLSDLAVQVGNTSRLLARFPSIGGTDTSGRSIIGDLNTIAGAANDVAVSPDTSFYAINRMIPIGQIDVRERDFGARGRRQADPRIAARHRISRRYRATRAAPLQHEPSRRHPEIHPVALARTRGRAGAERTAGSRHARSEHPGPNRYRPGPPLPAPGPPP